jgi:hypothetical protein
VQQRWTVGPLVAQNSPNNTIVTDGHGGLVVWHSPTEVNSLRAVLASQVFNVYYQGVDIHESTHISQALAAGVDGLASAGAGHILYMPPGTTNAFEIAAYAPQIAYLTQQVAQQQQFISQNGPSASNSLVLNQLTILLNQTTRNRDSYHYP